MIFIDISFKFTVTNISLHLIKTATYILAKVKKKKNVTPVCFRAEGGGGEAASCPDELAGN